MSDLKLPGDDEKKKSDVSMGRITIWVVVSGVALYLLISGIVGIIAKG
ncbi:MAG TPA: hypothetical protein VGP24_16915 [Glaciihabitans sp.]|jgi:hypothetical protein|nr:hypothetical protein [Glaciihabitans sp.]